MSHFGFSLQHQCIQLRPIKHICQCTQVPSLSSSVCTLLRPRENRHLSDVYFQPNVKEPIFTKIATPHFVLPHLHETASLFPLLHTALSGEIPNDRAKGISRSGKIPTCCNAACASLCAVTKIEPSLSVASHYS